MQKYTWINAFAAKNKLRVHPEYNWYIVDSHQMVSWIPEVAMSLKRGMLALLAGSLEIQKYQ